MVKIVLEREKCIGCGACQALCPKYWEISDDGKINLLGSKAVAGTENYELEIKEVECNQEATDSCPVQCIHLKKE